MAFSNFSFLEGAVRMRRLLSFPTRRSSDLGGERCPFRGDVAGDDGGDDAATTRADARQHHQDRKSTRLNSSHGYNSYAVFCLKKKSQVKGTAATTNLPAYRSTGQQPIFAYI